MNVYIAILIPACLMIIGFLYASVGHGGASGYIAVLSLFNIPAATYKPVVLVLNIVIAGLAFIHFYRAGHFRWKLCWPFLLTSIPFAFLGSQVAVHDKFYNILLGAALVLPVIRLLGFTPSEKKDKKRMPLASALLIGAFIGFLAGLLNIGGGIFLTPVLILFAWSNAKEAAAISALFIVCNSMAGLLGNAQAGINFAAESYTWLAGAVTGGLAGAYFGSMKFRQLTLQHILAGVLCIACIKLLFLM
jgi:uncharacterized membrane protein YfcA